MFESYPIYKVERKDFSKYPLFKRFLEIPDPPKQIYYRGNVQQFADIFDAKHKIHFLSVVGSRTVTNYGKDSIHKIISPLAGQPICIISGLAIGVDGLSHKEALGAGLQVIAIPGSGLGEKVLYPKTNRDIAFEILKNGGLLLSEYEEDFKSMLHAFPARNRLMAALSDAVLLIEASTKSGTMITARLATEYNKDIWCVPGSIFSANSEGTNNLIKNGAALISNHKDVLHNFRISSDETEKENNKKSLTKNIEKLNLTLEEKKIVTYLVEPLSKDILMEKTKLEFSDFLTGLTMLEMKSLVKIDGGIVRKVF